MTPCAPLQSSPSGGAAPALVCVCGEGSSSRVTPASGRCRWREQEQSIWLLGKEGAGGRAGLWGLRHVRCSPWAPGVGSEESRRATWAPLPLSVLPPHFGSWFLFFSVPISFSLAHFLRSHSGRKETLGLPEEATPLLGPHSQVSRPGQGTRSMQLSVRPGHWLGSWTQGTEGGCRAQRGPGRLTLQSVGSAPQGQAMGEVKYTHSKA